MNRRRTSRNIPQRAISCRQQANRRLTYARIGRENQMDLALKLTGFTPGSIRAMEADGLIRVTTDNASDVLRPVRR